MKKPVRIKNHKNRLWHRSYIIHHYMFRNISEAIAYCLGKTLSDGISSPVVLDIGCGNKPYKSLFLNCNYLGVDRSVAGATPDIVASADDLHPISDCMADIVFSTQTIEHLPDPFAAVSEMGRVLKKGGYFIVTGPMYWPLHEEPYDFFRFTPHGLSKIIERAGMNVISIKNDGGTWAMIGQAIAINIPAVLRPISIITNVAFICFDYFSGNVKSPANYTVIARK